MQSVLFYIFLIMLQDKICYNSSLSGPG